jgi:hypothetical protein
MDKLDCARLEAIAERLRAAMAEFLRLLLARDNSSHTASENCFHRCFHNETKQQIMSRKKKGEKPAETDFSPLLDSLIVEQNELRIWGLGVRIPPGAPIHDFISPPSPCHRESAAKNELG